MKKFFLMLAVALPMFFMASCGDDNDEVDVPYSMPVLTKSASNVLTISNMSINLEWGDDMGDVKEAMRPFSYVLNDQVSNSSALAYTFDADGNYPFYIYAFVGGNLASSSIVITEEMDSEVDFTKYFKDNKYKEVSTDEDDDLIYESKDKMTLVH